MADDGEPSTCCMRMCVGVSLYVCVFVYESCIATISVRSHQQLRMSSDELLAARRLRILAWKPTSS